jgi:hypothetical protein
LESLLDSFGLESDEEEDSDFAAEDFASSRLRLAVP